MTQRWNRRCCFVLLAVSLAACAEKPKEGAFVDPEIQAQMEKFENRTIYKKLDPAVLAAIPDEELEQAVIDYVASKLEGRYEKEVAIVAGLPKGARALYVTWGVEAEVNNGGFNQYYWNTEDRFADQAVVAFELFAASKHAELMREANRIREQERTEIERFKAKGTLTAFSDSYKVSKLGPLDDRFYALDENLSALRIAKIRAEPALFSGN